MATTMNNAISGLVATVTALNLAGVDVYDGPPQQDGASNPDAVFIGFQTGQLDAVTFTRDWATMGAVRSEEHYDVLCELQTFSGDTDIASRRARAFVLLDAIAAAITTDRTLAGAVRLASISTGNVQPEQTDRGCTVTVPFSVSCVARITT